MDALLRSQIRALIKQGGSGALKILEGLDLWTFGHSYFTGPDAGKGIGWRTFERNYMATISSRASAGTTAGAMVDQIKGVSLSNGGGAGGALMGLNMICSLINNVSAGHSTATVVEQYRAALAYLTCLRMSNTDSITYGSGWSAGVTTTAGSHFDFFWTGDSAYIPVTFTTAAATVSVRNSGTGDVIAKTVTTGGYGEAFVGVIPLTGYGAGTHCVRITLETGAGLTVYGTLLPNSAAPTILWAQEGAIPAFSAPQNTLLTSTYRDAVAAILPAFPTVIAVAPTGWDGATMTRDDGTHPNSRGLAFWGDRFGAALASTDYRQGQNVVTSLNPPTYTGPGVGTYSSYNFTSHVYTPVKTWASAGEWIYTMSPEADFPLTGLVSGNHVVIPAGITGWTAGTYAIVSTAAGFSTADGNKNMIQLASAPAAANTTGGSCTLTV